MGDPRQQPTHKQALHQKVFTVESLRTHNFQPRNCVREDFLVKDLVKGALCMPTDIGCLPQNERTSGIEIWWPAGYTTHALVFQFSLCSSNRNYRFTTLGLDYSNA